MPMTIQTFGALTGERKKKKRGENILIMNM